MSQGSSAPPTSPAHITTGTEPIGGAARARDAQRAAEVILSSAPCSSTASSVHSLQGSSHSAELPPSHPPYDPSHPPYDTSHPPNPHYYYPPSYGSYQLPPPSYHNYGYYSNSFSGPGPGAPPMVQGMGPGPPNMGQGPPNMGQGPPHMGQGPPNMGPPGMFASPHGPSPLQPPPSHRPPPHIGGRMPPHMAHLQYSSVGGGYGSQSFPVIMTDDLVSGTQHNGKLSPVRRFFLLLVTFDILFTCLLWIIAILVTGRDLYRELHQQVLEYTIHSSMFDCVAASAGRFLVCLLVYGLLDISHWWAITVTTTCTVVFLIAKVFQYQWHDQPITYDVMLVLLSFILAWGEAWFFDFRMIPLESKAKEIWGSAPQRGGEEDERAPLLAGGGQGGMLARYVEGSTLYEGSVRNFYSPFESPEISDNEEEELEHCGVRVPRKFRRKNGQLLSEQESEYKKLGEEMLVSAWRTINSPDWKLESKRDNGDMVQVKQVNGKRVFRLTGYVDISPRLLLEELFYGIESVPTWNPTLTECKTVQPIDEFTDISYQVCAEAGGGVVSTRDFVNLRHWSVVEGVFVSAGGSVTHPAMPPQRGRVRGENGPGCWAMRPVEGEPDKCLFQWLLNTDIKGWIPQSIIDKALSGTQFDYIANIRVRALALKEHGGAPPDLDSTVASCSEWAGET